MTTRHPNGYDWGLDRRNIQARSLKQEETKQLVTYGVLPSLNALTRKLAASLGIERLCKDIDIGKVGVVDDTKDVKMGLDLSIVVPFFHVAFANKAFAFPRFIPAGEITPDGEANGKPRDEMARFQRHDYSAMTEIGHHQHVWTQLPCEDMMDHDGDWKQQIENAMPCSLNITYFRCSIYDQRDDLKWSVLVRGVVKEHESLFVEPHGEYWNHYLLPRLSTILPREIRGNPDPDNPFTRYPSTPVLDQVHVFSGRTRGDQMRSPNRVSSHTHHTLSHRRRMMYGFLK